MRTAILSLACRYPEAPTPAALWDNVCAGRRAFRAVPPARLDLARYGLAVLGEADSITPVKAGLLTDWRFDRERFLIPQPMYEATDLAHWLALEVAAEAIAQAGGIARLDRRRTAVVVANTLTGEFSRAAMLRLRQPFLDDMLAEAMAEAGLEAAAATGLRRGFAAALRRRLAEPNAETLAGGLANTIAGRIANYFDLHGGAYTVDGACASSLLALANAADLLALGRADAVVVGAVDLSLDPFELVGFSRAGALARDDMLVFDARSAGFWPGEGAGFAVLMRADEARRREFPVRAILRGCGLSTDGAGGLTRPSESGQSLALRRAYEQADTDPADIAYVEAHGTGTAIGDPTEVRALASMREGAAAPLPIGSIKANIGHTKAAAGFAGLIKAVVALEAGLVPPHVGCERPHPAFAEVDGRVEPALTPRPLPDGAAAVGVSSFGFGGINMHAVLERAGRARPSAQVKPPRPQDAELFAFSGASVAAVAAAVARIATRAPSLSLAEMTDAAAACASALTAGPVRVAIVAGDPDRLAALSTQAVAALTHGQDTAGPDVGVFVSRDAAPARIGFLFPGQAAPVRRDGGAWERRFADVPALLARVPASSGDAVETATAQPAIVAASLAGLRLLRRLGLEPAVVVGHSLGELTALAAAGAIAETDLVDLASARGRAMSEHGRGGGGMLRIATTAEAVERLIAGLDLALACRNGPEDTVVSGPHAALREAERRARGRGFEVGRLAVSHAFHSPMMAPAVAAFEAVLSTREIGAPSLPLVSTVTGAPVTEADDVASLLLRQLVAPVEFSAALAGAAARADLFLEVGPGFGLTRLARDAGLAAHAIDAFGPSLAPLLGALAAAFVHGAPVRLADLFADRPMRAIDLTATPRFLESPCGRRDGVPAPDAVAGPAPAASTEVSGDDRLSQPSDPLAAVRAALAEETGLPRDLIDDDSRFLDNLHLNSLAVGRLVARAARAIGTDVPVSTEFANASARELAAGLVALRESGPRDRRDDERVGGVRNWVRSYAVHWADAAAIPPAGRPVRWRVVTIGRCGSEQAQVAELSNGDAADGLLVWMADGTDESSSAALFAACRSAWENPGLAHLALCHAGAPVAAFARSLAIEGRFKSVTVIERSAPAVAIAFLAGEIGVDASGFSELRFAADGRRTASEFRPVRPASTTGAELDASDVVMVTAGGKGIAAECALRLAARCGAALILVGRSGADDEGVAATLDRAAKAGIRCRYAQADVTDARALTEAVAAAAAVLGPVTALIHAAGNNQPQPFMSIADDDVRAVMAPKTAGLRAAVAAAGPGLRRIVTFGSMLGRMGLKGEAHYALANAWQSAIAEAIARERPDCAVLSLEWSIWNGAGMGHRLGSIDRLARFGVDAIPLDDGLAAFERLVTTGAVGTIMVTSRFGPPREVCLEPAELPILRFVDTPLVHFPGVELVVETILSAGRDPCLADHALDGLMLLPAVFGLEAMAQVAGALAGAQRCTAIERVAFERAVSLSRDGALRIRVMALRGDDDRVEAVIRAEDDGFATDRMRASFRFAARPSAPRRPAPWREDDVDAAPLYGRLFFQRGGFARVSRYTHLSARRVRAQIAPGGATAWFGPLEPAGLVLGDPGARDAMLHALQAAVPHRTVVPVAAQAVAFQSGGALASVEAQERRATADTFVFDIVGRDAAGRIVETWTAAEFRAVGATAAADGIAFDSPLAAPYVERVAREVLDEPSIAVAIVSGAASAREERRRRAFAALDIVGEVGRRGDGKPVLRPPARGCASVSHLGGATLAVAATREIGCDVAAAEAFAPGRRHETGSAGSPHRQAPAPADDTEMPAVTAARWWAAGEVAVKCGRRLDETARYHASGTGDVVLFEAPFGRTMTLRLPDPAGDVIVAVGVTRAVDAAEEPRSMSQPAWPLSGAAE